MNIGFRYFQNEGALTTLHLVAAGRRITVRRCWGA
jgi:hypothetical protein